MRVCKSHVSGYDDDAETRLTFPTPKYHHHLQQGPGGFGLMDEPEPTAPAL